MISIGMRYLCGWSASMDVSSRMKAEWPPHPGRLYMALAATHFETGAEVSERSALEWLEAQPAPKVSCSLGGQVLERDVAGVYVPVNDSDSGKEILPAFRPKQLRTFPRVRPDSDTVYFHWEATPSTEVRHALRGLCSKLTRVGHSTSLVQAWLEEGLVIPSTLSPDPMGAVRMRVPGEGLLRELEANFNGPAITEYQQLQEAAADASPRLRKKLKEEIREKFPDGEPTSRRPEIGTWQGYSKIRSAETEDTPAPGIFDPNLLILSLKEGPSLNIESTIQLTGALRDVVMKSSKQPPPEWVSGHEAGGRASRKPHLAFFPLPFVGGDYGDGHILGLAIAIPRGVAAEELREQLGPVLFDPASGNERAIHLWKNQRSGDGKVWDWQLQREDRQYPPQTLRAETWTQASREWASVTPVVLHHYPKKNRPDHIEAILREACASAGLPDPALVTTSSVSYFRGAGTVLDVPPFTEGGTNLSRYQVHARLFFRQCVDGPVLVGRGRYRGYGVFRPVDARGEKA